jgi:hypothetical protein
MLAGGAFAQAASAAGRPLLTGVSGVYDLEQAEAMANVAATGAAFVRIEVEWNGIAPGVEPSDWRPEDPGDPSYHWDRTDAGVINAVASGLTPVLSVTWAPTWANRCRSEAGTAGAPCDPDPDALASFATAAARRYSGSFEGLPRVRYWQGLNEPNFNIYFNPQFESGKPVSPRLYRTLLNSFYAAIKAVDSSNLVLAAGLGPVTVPGLTVGPMRFTRLLLCMRGGEQPRPTAGNCGGGVHFDIFDIHPYSTGGPTHQGRPDDVQMGDLGKLRVLLAAADRAGRIQGRFRRTPLWITEMGWDSNPPDPGGLSMSIETRWTAEALYRAWKAGVSRFFWYSLRDGRQLPGVPLSESNESGLYLRGPTVAEDRPKRNLNAFRFPFVAFHPKRRLAFWGRTPTSGGGPVSIQIKKRGAWRTMKRTRADSSGIFQGAVSTNYGSNKRGFVRAKFSDKYSPAFSMRPVRDFRQAPFGNPVD